MNNNPATVITSTHTHTYYGNVEIEKDHETGMYTVFDVNRRVYGEFNTLSDAESHARHLEAIGEL